MFANFSNLWIPKVWSGNLTISAKKKCLSQDGDVWSSWPYVLAAAGWYKNMVSSTTALLCVFLPEHSAHSTRTGAKGNTICSTWRLRNAGLCVGCERREPHEETKIGCSAKWQSSTMVHMRVSVPKQNTTGAQVPRQNCHIVSVWETLLDLEGLLPMFCMARNYFEVR